MPPPQPGPKPRALDRAPRFLLRAQAWLYAWLSSESRVVLGMVVVVLAVVVAITLSSTRLLRIVLDGLDIVALVAVFLVNWLGNGGALVPIPGARFVGLLLVFQQAVILPSWEVFAMAGAAMALGLSSYYIAGARTAASYAEGDAEGAAQLAHDTGMLDEDAVEFSPGADLDVAAVEAMVGADRPPADTADRRPAPASTGRVARLRRSFTTSLKRAQERAQPIIEQRGLTGMFLLCFAPTPLGTAAAYVGGLIHFSFSRYLLASFAAKYLLTGIVVFLALVFSDTAEAVAIPEIHIPILDITLFDDGLPSLPQESPAPGATGTPSD